mmetsp:Transcript_91918/g.260184  ORF Transcript_91918/g.260184 Transcript_91918/m.260184 type:complete len:266 (+) Transcript_91918:782-1579(+)
MKTLLPFALYSSSIWFSGFSSSMSRSRYLSHMPRMACGRIASAPPSPGGLGAAGARHCGSLSVFRSPLRYGWSCGFSRFSPPGLSPRESCGRLRALSISRLSRSNSRHPCPFQDTQWDSRSSTCLISAGKPLRVCESATSHILFRPKNSDRVRSPWREIFPPESSRRLEPSCSRAWKAIITCVRNCCRNPGSSSCTPSARARGACRSGAGSGGAQGWRGASSGTGCFRKSVRSFDSARWKEPQPSGLSKSRSGYWSASCMPQKLW